MRNMNVPQSPDEAKRMRSGFWTHDYRIENDETVWRCDLRKLDEAVRRIMLDRQFSMAFAQDPKRFLDEHFGEGTGYCYSHSRQDMDRPYMDYRFPRWMDQEKARYYRGIDWARDDKVDAMAYLYNTGTSTNTTTATTASGSTYWINDFMKDEIKRTQERMISKGVLGSKPKDKPIRFKKKLVKTLPFKVETGGSLLASLQREFDHWAGDQMRLVNG